jgi:hypothetical protein
MPPLVDSRGKGRDISLVHFPFCSQDIQQAISEQHVRGRIEVCPNENGFKVDDGRKLFSAWLNDPYFPIVYACALVGYPYIAGVISAIPFGLMKPEASVVTVSLGTGTSSVFLEQAEANNSRLTKTKDAV